MNAESRKHSPMIAPSSGRSTSAVDTSGDRTVTVIWIVMPHSAMSAMASTIRLRQMPNRNPMIGKVVK
jgi:hypothetical protein